MQDIVCILKEMFQKLECKTNLFREIIYFQTKYEICVDFRKPNYVQIENWVILEEQHFFQFCTLFFTEILHKC